MSFQLAEERFVAAGEVEDGGPFALVFALPDDLAVEKLGGFGGADVAVEGEVAGVAVLGVLREVDAAGGWFVLGGEEECGVEVAGGLLGFLELV